MTSVADLAATATGPGGALRVSTEYPELTGRYLESHGVKAEVSLSYGATEAKVPDIADCVVEITETGRALRAAGLKIVETLLVSHTELIANPVSAADPDKRHAMEQLLTLLQGSLEARGKVLVKLNVAAEQLAGVIEVLPSLRSPTVSELFGGGGFAVETVVPQVGDQRPHPRPAGPGGHRHHRAGPVQDRPLTGAPVNSPLPTGPEDLVPVGLGHPARHGRRVRRAAGARHRAVRRPDASRSTARPSADGTRTIAVGTEVAVRIAAGRLGRLEARSVRPLPRTPSAGSPRRSPGGAGPACGGRCPRGAADGRSLRLRLGGARGRPTGTCGRVRRRRRRSPPLRCHRSPGIAVHARRTCRRPVPRTTEPPPRAGGADPVPRAGAVDSVPESDAAVARAADPVPRAAAAGARAHHPSPEPLTDPPLPPLSDPPLRPSVDRSAPVVGRAHARGRHAGDARGAGPTGTSAGRRRRRLVAPPELLVAVLAVAGRAPADLVDAGHPAGAPGRRVLTGGPAGQRRCAVGRPRRDCPGCCGPCRRRRRCRRPPR